MKPVSTSQISAFHALLAKNKMMDEKRTIIAQLSAGRCTSTKDLFFDELQPWIDGMNGESRKVGKSGSQKDKSRMLGNMFAIAHELGMIKKRNAVNPDGSITPVNDYSDLHQWVLKYGYLHKHLNDYTYKELPVLVTAFKKMYISKLKK